MPPIISCPDSDVLGWFLARTDLSFVYAAADANAKLFPEELTEIAIEKKMAIDYGVTSAEVLTRFLGMKVAPGTTAFFLGTELIGVSPSLLETPELILADAVFSLFPEFRQLKREGRAGLMNALLDKVRGASLLGMEEEVANHRWTPPEMEQTIDLHLEFRSGKPGRDDAIEVLARSLKLGIGQVAMAVSAVGSLDPEDPRRYPKPSKKLAKLWAKRGYQNKLGL